MTKKRGYYEDGSSDFEMAEGNAKCSRIHGEQYGFMRRYWEAV
jgi:hypothetical protein